MGLFDNNEQLESIAERLHASSYDPFFVSRHDFEERFANDSSYSELSEIDRDKVFNYYSNHEFYAELKAEKTADRKAADARRMQSLIEQENKVREQAEREAAWEKEANERERYVAARLSQKNELESLFLKFYEFKYKILGARTKEERAVVDFFDKTIDTPAFARFYKYKTGHEFKPISYVPGEYFDIFKYKEKDNFDIPKEWYALKDKKRFDPTRINVEERIEYFEKYGIYLIDGSFLKYLKNVEKFKPLITHIENFDKVLNSAHNGRESLNNLFASKALKTHNRISLALSNPLHKTTLLKCKDYYFKLFAFFFTIYVTGMLFTENYILCSIGAVCSTAISFLAFVKLAQKNDECFNSNFNNQVLETAKPSRITQVDTPNLSYYENPLTAFDYAFLSESIETLEADFANNLDNLHSVVESDSKAFLKALKENFGAFEKQLDVIHEERLLHIKKYFSSYFITIVCFTLIFVFFI